MTTVVVYKTDTKEVLAAIPMDGGDAVCRNDVEFQIYNGTEPIFTETPGGIVLAENKFMIKMEGNNDVKKEITQMNELLLEQNAQLRKQNNHLNMVILSVCSKSVRDRKDQEEKREKATERDTPEKETPESSV